MLINFATKIKKQPYTNEHNFSIKINCNYAIFKNVDNIYLLEQTLSLEIAFSKMQKIVIF